jgi:hypothetical protein
VENCNKKEKINNNTTKNKLTNASKNIAVKEGSNLKYVNEQENFNYSLKSKSNNNNNKNDEQVTNNENELKNELKNDDPIISYLNSNREITDNEINTAPIIILREESGNLFNGQTIKINAGGLIGGRNLRDGVAIFGIKKNDLLTLENNTLFTPDFVLNSEENLNYPYIFAIYFNKEKKNYNIRAYGGKDSDNRILFIKLTGKFSLPIKQKEIISVGNVIFQVTPIENNKIEIINISRKDSLNESDGNKKIFDCNITKDITIGRDKNCDFSFAKDKSFSRIQTSFSYDQNNKYWVISDGSKVKSSTNGTWVFGTHSFEIMDEMLVEILTSKIKFSVSNIH